MIFIDLTGFVPEDGWRYEAWMLTQELIALPTETERARLIHEHRAFWGKIKKSLPFNDKCWFSEAKESVSVYEIEHFRPTKATGRTKKISKIIKTFAEANRVDWVKANRYKGSGYWWLAFDYTNYRNTGKLINQKKGIRFPLESKSFVAYTAGDDYRAEQPLLLDPIKLGDAELLTFDTDGKARSTISDPNTIEYLRAMTSIEVYGLNSIDSLVKHRSEKWSSCFRAIRRAEKNYQAMQQAVIDDDNDEFVNRYVDYEDLLTADILPAINKAGEFSSVAMACVQSFAGYEWIKNDVLKT